MSDEMFVRKRVPTVVLVYQMWCDDKDTVTLTLIFSTGSKSFQAGSTKTAWKYAKAFLTEN